MANTQSKLGKSRSPRVQITYDVEVGGAESKKELPLVIGVVGHFSQDEKPLRERRFTHIDKDNFDDVMVGLHPSLDLLVDSTLPEKEGKLPVALKFNSMEDFSPENIVKQVEPLRKLMELREQLSDLRNRTASNDRLKEELINYIVKQKADDTQDHSDKDINS